MAALLRHHFSCSGSCAPILRPVWLSMKSRSVSETSSPFAPMRCSSSWATSSVASLDQPSTGLKATTRSSWSYWPGEQVGDQRVIVDAQSVDQRLLARKPAELVAVAVANKMVG
jgi:hypothetical protein